MSKSHPKLAHFCMEKRFGPKFSKVIVEESPKLPGTGKQSQSGHLSLHLMVLTPNISIHLWDFVDGQRGLCRAGRAGKVHAGLQPLCKYSAGQVP